jgi:hypothetical protein
MWLGEESILAHLKVLLRHIETEEQQRKPEYLKTWPIFQQSNSQMTVQVIYQINY